MRKRTASGKAHPVGGYHFGVFPWVFVSLRRSFTYKNGYFNRISVLLFCQKPEIAGYIKIQAGSEYCSGTGFYVFPDAGKRG